MLKIISGDLSKMDTECIVIPVSEGIQIHSHRLIIRLTEKALTIDDFKGKSGDELLLYENPEIKSPRVLFIGLGKAGKINLETLRAAGGRAVKKCIKKKLTEMAFCLPDSDEIPIERNEMIESLLEGAFLANHIFNYYKKEKQYKPLKQITLYKSDTREKIDSRIKSRVEAICKGTILAREWVNLPPNEKRPDQLVRSMHKAAVKESIEVTILDEKALKKNKMGGILAVGAGSQSRPKMLILDYKPKKNGRPQKTKKNNIVLVGKGVTFDSGGINLKPPEGLADMKMDMSGAASVAAALITAAKLKLKFRVTGIIPIVENMPSGNASRPGDIIHTHFGKTVEIKNTDAEGRLILVDALSYANKMFAPDIMIDLATLTGACIIALGEKIAGVFTQDKQLSDMIVSSGEKTYERCWAMPMPEDYKDQLKSDFADIKNITGIRWGGAISAALFLAEFVKKTRWAHIDIAGPAYSRNESDYCGTGGTGFGVRLIMDVISKL